MGGEFYNPLNTKDGPTGSTRRITDSGYSIPPENACMVKGSYGPFNGGYSEPSVNIEKDLGRKFDAAKLEYGLVPPLSLKSVVEILTIGAQKYDRDNWKYVPDGKRRYFDAAMRHLWDWKCGDRFDEETSKNHLAHAICNLMFLLEKDLLTE